MATATELFDSYKPTADVKGSRDVRRFYVVTDTLEDNPLLVSGVPNYYDVHPRLPQAKVDSKTIETKIGPASNDGTAMQYIVAVNYSNDQSYRITNKPLTREISYKAWSMSFSKREISIPYLLGETITLVGSEGATVTKFVWFRHELKADDVWNINVSRRVNVNSWTFADTKRIMDQRGKFHYLDGLTNGNNATTLAKFMGADPNQLEADRWEVTYSWLIDPGNPSPDLSGLPIEMQPQWYPHPRPPFYAYIVIPQTDMLTAFVDVEPTYHLTDIDQAGGLALPGNPLQ